MPPEVIFILILIIFSVLESALRGKKGPRGDGLPGPGRTPDWPAGEDDRPTRVERRPDRVVVAQRPEAPRETADQMVPDDIWEEIAALARGDVEETLRRRRARARGAETPEAAGRPATVEPPEPAPSWMPPPEDDQREQNIPSEEEIRPEIEVRSTAWGERRPFRTEGERKPLRKARATQAPVARSIPIRQGEISGARRESAEERARRLERLHHSFRGYHSLRHAMIAREVLGRPLALRDYGDEELWSQ